METRHDDTWPIRREDGRRSYGSPVVRDYGTIRDLTLGSNMKTPASDLSKTCVGGTDSHDCTT